MLNQRETFYVKAALLILPFAVGSSIAKLSTVNDPVYVKFWLGGWYNMKFIDIISPPPNQGETLSGRQISMIISIIDVIIYIF